MNSLTKRLRRLSALAFKDPRAFARRVQVRFEATLSAGSEAARRALSTTLDLGAEGREATAALARSFGLHGLPAPETTYGLSSDLPFGYDASVERTHGGFRILVSSASPEFSLRWLRHRIPCYAYWLAVCPPDVRRVTVTLSDGNHPTSGQFAPSTNLRRVTALPDPYFFDNNGFAAVREESVRRAVSWSDRSSVLVWRGATTGSGSFDPELALERPELAAQRMQVCVKLRDVGDTDVKFAYSSRREIPIEALERFGLRGGMVEEASWIKRKYALDIDGHTNSWQNLIVRLHLGCCVLKVTSGHGYRQWYYDRLQPWEHYVPVAADLSDLLERIDWVRSHDSEASEIARRGQALARTLTWDAVEAEAVALITANWDRAPGDRPPAPGRAQAGP